MTDCQERPRQIRRRLHLRPVRHRTGADDPIRTDDLVITSDLLYQLSYVGPQGYPSTRARKCKRCAVRQTVLRPRLCMAGSVESSQPTDLLFELLLCALEGVVDLLDIGAQSQRYISVGVALDVLMQDVLFKSRK